MKTPILLVIIIAFSCTKEKISSDETISNKKQQITIVFKNAPKEEFYSYNSDSIYGGKTYFKKLAYINNKYGLKKFIAPVSRLVSDTITIDVKKDITEINFYQKKLIEKSFIFFAGDSVLVKYDKNFSPIIQVLNREHDQFDYTYPDYKNYQRKLNPEEEYFRTVPNLPPAKLSKIEILDFLENEKIKSSIKFVNYLNERQNILDSLASLKLISKGVYEYYSKKNKYLNYSYLAKENLLNTDKLTPKSDFDNNTITNIRFNDQEDSKNEYFNRINNDNLDLTYSFYKEFFEYYYVPYNLERKTTKMIATFEDFGNTTFQYDIVFDSIQNSNLFSKNVKDYLLYKYMIKIANQLSNEKVKLYYTKFNKSINDKKYIEIFNQSFNVDLLETSKLSIVNIKNEDFFLEDILNKNKGKVIYLNFWATWCSPCIESMDAYETLIKEYANREITFLNISTEKDFKIWTDRTKKYTFMNTKNNYLLKNYYTSDLIKKNLIYFIPRYLIVDKNGRLINNNAPKPSSPQILETLESALE